MNSVQHFERSAVGAAQYDAKNATAFRFPFRGEAYKPSRRIVSAHQPRRVSSLTWSNPWQGFLPNPKLNRTYGECGHTATETWPVSLWGRSGVSDARGQQNPHRGEEGKRQPLVLFTDKGCGFLSSFLLFPQAKGGTRGVVSVLVLGLFYGGVYVN